MTKHRSYFTLLIFVLIVSGVALSSAQFQPGEWYAHLQKPGWTPPNWIFAPVWGVLYLMIAVTGWLIFSSSSTILKTLWIAQLVLNGLWSWLFFGLHRTGLGLIDILTMFACIATLLALSCKASKAVGWLMAPYLVWVGYASTLNAAIYLLNPA
jgi:translocator protein